MAQWHGGAATTCQLQYRGEVAGQDTKLLTASFCAGLLEQALDEDVNIVNSEMLMKERGIQLTEQRDTEMGDFSSSIAADVASDGAIWSAAGTLFGKKMPRLIRLGQYRLEAYLDGVLCIFTHQDVPGIIGKVGSAFGSHDINIAQMSVGREGSMPGGTAIGVLNLDAIPPQAAIDAVLRIPSIQSVHLVQLPPAGELPAWLQGLL
jgi:D-3-phosphoglycerate dehydrogenase / 2-oxoglutarate reductase